MLKKDSLVNGVVIGAVLFMITAVIITAFNYMWVELLQYPNYLAPPKLQLVVLFFNLIFFRFMISKWKKTETAKGMFLVIAVSVAFYLLINKIHI